MFADKHQTWWEQLTVAQQTMAIAMAGLPLPTWMIDTLAALHIPTVTAQLDGAPAQLALTSLSDFLELKSRNRELDCDSPGPFAETRPDERSTRSGRRRVRRPARK